MDDALVRKILSGCGRCLARFDATLEHQTALTRAREAKAKLEALESGSLPQAEMEALVTKARKGLKPAAPAFDAAVARTKQRLGIDAPVKKPGGAERMQLPRSRLVACIRGDISPSDLAKELKTTTTTIARNINELIGPADGTLWRKGIGMTRGGVRAIELLAQTDKRAAVESVKSEPPPRAKKKQKRAGMPTAEIPRQDLVRLINKRTSAAVLARKHKLSLATVYKYARELRVRFGVPNQTRRGRGGPKRNLTENEMRADNVSAPDLQRVVDGKYTVTQLARKYRTSEPLVRNKLAEYKARNARRSSADVVAASIVESAKVSGSNGVAPDAAAIVEHALAE